MTEYPFSAAKLDERGDWDYLNSLTLDDWLDEQHVFFPIKPGEFFRLIVPEGTDLLGLLSEGMFDGNQNLETSSVFLDDNYLSETVPMGVYDFWFDIDGHPERIQEEDDKYVRFAVVLRGDEVWQLVGFKLGDRIVYALQRNWDVDEDETPELSDRFTSRRVLIDYSFHTDGPGPVSWDVHSALLDMGDWALGVHDADWGVVGRPVTLEPSLPEAIFAWLEFNDVLELFVLKHATCNWVDESLREELEDARWSFYQIAGLDSSLSGSEVAVTLEMIRASQATAGELLRMIERAEDARAADFVKRVTESADAEDASLLFRNWI
jgi:hypothetical protein